MISETHIAKAIRASEGKSLRAMRGALDQVSKSIAADRQILARIVKECVVEAASLSVREIEQLIPGDVQINAVPVSREDAAADPGGVRQDNTEDGTADEGTVRFDILFTLRLPSEREPILLIVNVKVQNRTNLPYPLERRAVIYADRLVGRQGTDYRNCKKVYSIWIVSGPRKQMENTVMRLVTARQTGPDSFEAAPEAAQVSEVWFLNLGEPDDEQLESSLLGLLDVVFSNTIAADQKIQTLKNLYSLRTTAEMADNLEVMQNMELAIEARAWDKGRAEGRVEGRDQGKIEATLLAAKTLKMSPDAILPLLALNFDGDTEKAQRLLDDYLKTHPADQQYMQQS
ncbi:MAG: hypothetical protein HDQ87_00230 [Clostridia bacterium]|nr:hypothetical protein [Clostridia bacterium]